MEVELHQINSTTLEYTDFIKFGDGSEIRSHGYLVKTNEGWKIDEADW